MQAKMNRVTAALHSSSRIVQRSHVTRLVPKFAQNAGKALLNLFADAILEWPTSDTGEFGIACSQILLPRNQASLSMPNGAGHFATSAPVPGPLNAHASEAKPCSSLTDCSTSRQIQAVVAAAPTPLSKANPLAVPKPPSINP